MWRRLYGATTINEGQGSSKQERTSCSFDLKRLTGLATLNQLAKYRGSNCLHMRVIIWQHLVYNKGKQGASHRLQKESVSWTTHMACRMTDPWIRIASLCRRNESSAPKAICFMTTHMASRMTDPWIRIATRLPIVSL